MYSYNLPSGNSYYNAAQPMFPQPNGNVYVIQNSLEVANIPTGAGLTVAMCPSENLAYVKTIQNGSPVFLAYKMIAYNESNTTVEDRLAALEEQINKLAGGKNNESIPATKPTVWET